MLVTCTTKTYTDITMFGDVAGTIVAEAVPAGVSRITAVIEAEKVSEPAEDKDAVDPENSMVKRARHLNSLNPAVGRVLGASVCGVILVKSARKRSLLQLGQFTRWVQMKWAKLELNTDSTAQKEPVIFERTGLGWVERLLLPMTRHQYRIL